MSLSPHALGMGPLYIVDTVPTRLVTCIHVLVSSHLKMIPCDVSESILASYFLIWRWSFFFIVIEGSRDELTIWNWVRYETTLLIYLQTLPVWLKSLPRFLACRYAEILV